MDKNNVKKILVECARCGSYLENYPKQPNQYFSMHIRKHKITVFEDGSFVKPDNLIFKKVIFEHPLCDKCTYSFNQWLNNE